MAGNARRLVGTLVIALLVCGAIGIYIGLYLTNVPGSAGATQTSSGTQLNIATVAAAATNDAHPTWVSYYAVDANDQHWRHVTTFNVPAHTLVHVRIFQFDGQSGL